MILALAAALTLYNVETATAITVDGYTFMVQPADERELPDCVLHEDGWFCWRKKEDRK
jgi:hypothetical protein